MFFLDSIVVLVVVLGVILVGLGLFLVPDHLDRFVIQARQNPLLFSS